MITFIWLAALIIIAGGALLVYSKNSGSRKASKAVERTRESKPSIGRATGSGDD